MRNYSRTFPMEYISPFLLKELPAATPYIFAWLCVDACDICLDIFVGIWISPAKNRKGRINKSKL